MWSGASSPLLRPHPPARGGDIASGPRLPAGGACFARDPGLAPYIQRFRFRYHHVTPVVTSSRSQTGWKVVGIIIGKFAFTWDDTDEK